jgi:hypothetical protein
MLYAGEDELTQMMGIGYLGEVRPGPDGGQYQWTQGVDGLGNPVGFWRRLRRFARRRLRPFIRRALPLVQRFAPLVPGGAAVAEGLRVAAPALQQAGVSGLGALYQAPDGTLYQMQGLGQDDELQGYGEDDELQGLAEDDELQGYGEDDELQGYGEDDELQGIDGYVRQQGVSGLGAFVPQQPPSTPWFQSPATPPEIWRPLW